MVDRFNIRYIGLGKMDLTDYQESTLKKFSIFEARKIQRKINNNFKLTVHFKEYEKAGKDGKRTKCAVNIKLDFPGRVIQSHKGKSGTWIVGTALKKSFANLKNELEKKFKN